MPLYINTAGAIAAWLDTKPGTHYNLQEGVRPAAVPMIAAKVQSECRWKLLTTSNAKVLEILNLFARSSQDEKARERAGKVHYRNTVKKDTDDTGPDTWDDLANLILSEIATNSNRMREIEMAMIVVKSPVILGTVNTTIVGIEKLMMAVRLSRGASLKTADNPKKPLEEPAEYDLRTLGASADIKKFYLPWTQHKSVDAALGDSGAGFTMRVALLHDLMEFAVMMFKHKNIRDTFGFRGTPMSHPETVSTGEGVKDRDGPTETASIQYAKSLHCPVECGPSYTTTRLLRLPDAISILTSNEAAEDSKPPKVDPLKKHPAVRVVAHPPGYLRLSPDQKGHIAWAIFGWWTLNFPKHWGDGAHCFFEVPNAARSCGVPIVTRPGVYPTRDEVCTRLQVTWTPADTAELARRKTALLSGAEQATVTA